MTDRAHEPATSLWGLFLSAWSDRRSQLRSDLNADQCLQRLREDFSGLFGGESGEVRGRMIGREAHLMRRTLYRNSFRTVVRVSLSDRGAATAIQTLAGVAMPARIFMLLWFSFLLMFVSLSLQAVASGSPVKGDWIYFLIVPGGMFVFGFALVAGCRYAARGDEAAVLAYLRRRLEAA